MMVTFGIAKLPHGKIRLEVQRPQHPAAHKNYASTDAVRRVLTELGVPADVIEFYFKLLPAIEPHQLLQFPPMYVPEYQLEAQGLKPGGQRGPAD
jgi:hypothetical protein